MLILPIGNETVLLKPVPFCFLEAYHYLIRLLPQDIGDIAASDRHWSDLQKLINLHPRADTGEYGFQLPEEYCQLDKIIQNLIELNEVSELPKLSKYAKQPPIAPQSSGNPRVDRIADLAALYGADGAQIIMSNLGQNELNQLIFRSNQQQVSTEEREEINRKEKYDRFVEKNRALVASLLGVPIAAIPNPNQNGNANHHVQQ